jgi:hypothetical protein
MAGHFKAQSQSEAWYLVVRRVRGRSSTGTDVSYLRDHLDNCSCATHGTNLISAILSRLRYFAVAKRLSWVIGRFGCKRYIHVGTDICLGGSRTTIVS